VACLACSGSADEKPTVPLPHRLSTVARLADEVIIQKHVEAAKGKQSPCAGATPSAFPETQDSDPILNGRPFKACAPPVHLYHDVFTMFSKIYNDKTGEIPDDTPYLRSLSSFV
jgi:hypothetical protein